jgi:hypothetical protein
MLRILSADTPFFLLVNSFDAPTISAYNGIVGANQPAKRTGIEIICKYLSREGKRWKL